MACAAISNFENKCASEALLVICQAPDTEGLWALLPPAVRILSPTGALARLLVKSWRLGRHLLRNSRDEMAEVCWRDSERYYRNLSESECK